MYLACADKEINERQERVYKENKKLIDDYNNLSWYAKLFTEFPRNKIINNWCIFERWMKNELSKKVRR